MTSQMNFDQKEVPDEDIPSFRGTLVYCPHCDDTIIRSSRFDHEHEIPDPDALFDSSDSEAGDDPEPETERAGAWYAITLSYTIDYRFIIPAWNEHHAKDEAEMKVDFPSNCVDGYQEYYEIDEGGIIMSDDDILPDDYDIYGSESVRAAIERQQRDTQAETTESN